jgi:Abi-like protein
MPYEILTPARLARYGDPTIDDKQDIIARYIWNVALSEALYPTLAILEVALRNRIDQAIVELLASDWLEPTSSFWPRNRSLEHTKLVETIRYLAPKHNRGHLVAELTFGFWIGLFKNEYKPLIWNKRRVFDAIFPNCSLKCVDRVSKIRPQLRVARILRNRISHHEAIFDIPQLGKTLKQIQQVISWVSSDGPLLLEPLDRFHRIYTEGWEAYK